MLQYLGRGGLSTLRASTRPDVLAAILEGKSDRLTPADSEVLTPAYNEVIELMSSDVRDIILILPTGSSKTLPFIISGPQDSTGTTIVVLPLGGLITDMVARATRISVGIIEWRPGLTGDSTGMK